MLRVTKVKEYILLKNGRKLKFEMDLETLLNDLLENNKFRTLKKD